MGAKSRVHIFVKKKKKKRTEFDKQLIQCQASLGTRDVDKTQKGKKKRKTLTENRKWIYTASALLRLFFFPSSSIAVANIADVVTNSLDIPKGKRKSRNKNKVEGKERSWTYGAVASPRQP